jgi:hypothetical protein
MNSLSADQRQLARHLLATLGFRVGKALEGAPQSFRDFRAAPQVNTPGMLIRHMTRLLHLARTAFGSQWPPEPVDGAWREEKARFFAALLALDGDFEEGEFVAEALPLETLLQGPLSDVLTHCGQINMLRIPIHLAFMEKSIQV